MEQETDLGRQIMIYSPGCEDLVALIHIQQSRNGAQSVPIHCHHLLERNRLVPFVLVSQFFPRRLGMEMIIGSPSRNRPGLDEESEATLGGQTGHGSTGIDGALHVFTSIEFLV